MPLCGRQGFQGIEDGDDDIRLIPSHIKTSIIGGKSLVASTHNSMQGTLHLIAFVAGIANWAIGEGGGLLVLCLTGSH